MHGGSAGAAARLRGLRGLALGHHVGRGQAMQRWLEGLGMSGALFHGEIHGWLKNHEHKD